MGFEDSNTTDDGDGKSHGSVSCSICLDSVTDVGVRSWAKLHCGHQFHLDCIGSAFNIKGVMQCPNCRKIEKGQWLFASSSRSSYPSEINIEDWTHDEDLYDLSYSEMGHGIHWCPFSGLSRLPVSFEEGDFSSTAYHDLLGQHAIYAEHTTVSAGHPCPYVAYFGPVPPPSSNSSGNVPESSNFSTPWNGPSIPPFPAVDVVYHHWENHSTPFSSTSSRVVGGGDQPPVSSGNQRPGRANHEIPRSGAIMHPFVLGHSSGARPGNSAASPMIPPYPGSNARARDRAQALQAYYQPGNPPPPPIRTPMIPGSRRSGHRAPSSDQTTGFFYFPSATPPSRNFQEGENTQLNPNRLAPWETEYSPSYPYHAVERDPSWGNFRQPNVGSNSSSRPRRQNRS